MDKIRSPTSMSMQPQNLSVSMAGTPGTPMVTFLLNVSSTGEKNSGVPPTQLAVSRGAPMVGREDQASPSLTLTCRRFQSWTSKEMYKHAFRVPLERVIPKHGWGGTKYAQTELQMWWLDAVVLPTHESAQRGRNEQPRRSITNQSTQFYLLIVFASFTWEWPPPIHFKCIIRLIFIIISVSDLLVLVVFFSNHLIHSWGCTENKQEINPLLDTNSHQQWS